MQSLACIVLSASDVQAVESDTVSASHSVVTSLSVASFIIVLVLLLTSFSLCYYCNYNRSVHRHTGRTGATLTRHSSYNAEDLSALHVLHASD
jgi:branched-subunit amino acid permease